MKYREFLEYLENNLDGYHTFMCKALDYQHSKNAKRPTKNRWNSEKVERAAGDMWRKSMETLYNNLKHEIKSDSASAWMNFIVKNEILETVNESISDMEFSDDAA